MAIIGLAGDPPTNAHIDLALFISSKKIVDEVWLMPCFSYNGDKKLETAEHRLEMLKIATKKFKNIFVSDFEIINKMSGKTFHTLNKLKEHYPEFSFYFSIGLDQANNINNWFKGPELIMYNPFIVSPRKGYSSREEWFKNEPHFYLQDYESLDISSTMIRELLNKNKLNEVRNFIDKDVLDYIVKNNLYFNN